MEPIVVIPSKFLVRVAIWGAVLMLVAIFLVFLDTWDPTLFDALGADPFRHRGMEGGDASELIGGVVLVGGVLAFLLYLAPWKPTAVFDADGVRDKRIGLDVLIPWSDVEAVTDLGQAVFNGVKIRLRDREKYWSRLGPLRRELLTRGRTFVGDDLVLGLVTSGVTAAELVAAANRQIALHAPPPEG